jgi:hypothetical protein
MGEGIIKNRGIASFQAFMVAQRAAEKARTRPAVKAVQ